MIRAENVLCAGFSSDLFYLLTEAELRSPRHALGQRACQLEVAEPVILFLLYFIIYL
jgi:hypothetical protein